MIIMVQAQVDGSAGKSSTWLLEHTRENVEGSLSGRDGCLHHVDVDAQHH